MTSILGTLIADIASIITLLFSPAHCQAVMLRSTLLLTLLVLTVLLCVALVSGVNLVQNPSFNSGTFAGYRTGNAGGSSTDCASFIVCDAPAVNCTAHLTSGAPFAICSLSQRVGGLTSGERYTWPGR